MYNNTLIRRSLTVTLGAALGFFILCPSALAQTSPTEPAETSVAEADIPVETSSMVMTRPEPVPEVQAVATAPVPAPADSLPAVVVPAKAVPVAAVLAPAAPVRPTEVLGVQYTPGSPEPLASTGVDVGLLLPLAISLLGVGAMLFAVSRRTTRP